MRGVINGKANTAAKEMDRLKRKRILGNIIYFIYKNTNTMKSHQRLTIQSIEFMVQLQYLVQQNSSNFL